MKNLKRVVVNTKSRIYPVFISHSVFDTLPELIKKFNLPEHTFIITDNKLEKSHSLKLKSGIEKIPGKKFYLTLNTSEKIKTFDSIRKIFEKLIEEKFGRDTLIIAIGGGIIGDLAAFSASTFMRGVSLVHVPTTIISAVDSSVGGKTAVNYKEVKNIIGTFYQPSFVLVDTEFLQSLSNKEFISGFGEILKYSYLSNNNFYSLLISNYDLYLKKDKNILNKIIYECIIIKAAVVSQDELETKGIRKILNFGHTFAHAFESSSNYKLQHGKAVIAGIVSSLYLSFRKGFLSKSKFEQMLSLPSKLKSQIDLKLLNENEVIKFMKYDKKNRKGKNQFVLIKNFGELLVDINVDEKEVLSAINETKKFFI